MSENKYLKSKIMECDLVVCLLRQGYSAMGRQCMEIEDTKQLHTPIGASSGEQQG